MRTRKTLNMDTFQAGEAAAANNPEVTQHEVKPKTNDLLGLVTMRR